ncbi:MAG: hypothetical protein IS860_04170 [Nitrosopumilus sp.]|nr:hypothetical protein [Nitrosopumilus sp.]
MLEKLKKILDDLKDHNNSKMKQVWKYSLKINDDSKIQQELEEIKKMQNLIPITFFNEVLESYRNWVIDVIASQKYIKQKLNVQRAIEKAKKSTKELGFSDDIVNSFLTRKSTLWKSEITQYVIKHGAVRVFDNILGKDGLFSNIVHKDASMRENFVSIRWLAWIGLISPSVIYSFPHEQIGRYPIMIENKNSEDWYEEKADELKFIIDDCDFGIKRVKDMMKQNMSLAT